VPAPSDGRSRRGPARPFGSARIELVQGDITLESTDAIVNAANSGLMGGGGVDGAIHRAGGPAILEECRKIVAERGPLAPGNAVITTAGRLSCGYVIHTVGPVWSGGDDGEPETLAACYRSCLELAASRRLKSIAFASISTGAYGYPVAQAAPVALGSVRKALKVGTPVEVARFVLFNQDHLEHYARALAALPE
jgi:O-acetyl-ADP-ribose deacetylase (regulator of RNase III)